MRTWMLLALVATMGIGAGVGGYTFFYAHGLSYLSSDPAACKHCHVMQHHYDSWNRASHHAVAVCVDCHLPADFVGKWWAKVVNGWHHSKAFTLQDFPDPIRITERNARILQQNCVRCHQDMVEEMLSFGGEDPQRDRCARCHAAAGHGPRE